MGAASMGKRGVTTWFRDSHSQAAAPTRPRADSRRPLAGTSVDAFPKPNGGIPEYTVSYSPARTKYVSCQMPTSPRLVAIRLLNATHAGQCSWS